jgi:hypothetical protein
MSLMVMLKTMVTRAESAAYQCAPLAMIDPDWLVPTILQKRMVFCRVAMRWPSDGLIRQQTRLFPPTWNLGFSPSQSIQHFSLHLMDRFLV